MARRQLLPDDLEPTQVVALQDALLSNADRLLQAAVAMLEGDSVPLARSLAILGMEESGKAIALHERRVRMAYAPEGEPFVDDWLKKVWGDHGLKLEVVHRFLVDEQYWFGVEPSDPEENARVLGAIEEWRRDHNLLKQRGFYVDVSPQGYPVTPEGIADVDAVREVIGHVHQIGWQLRLGEHIEGKRRLEAEQDVPPSTEEEIQNMCRIMLSLDQAMGDRILESMREGKKGKILNNPAYAFELPENPFATVGNPGHEAEDRELLALWQHVHPEASDEPGEPANAS
ncbi:AbiV family abortive infection protein [Microbacterium sp. kSW2-24]|uniref:AbiV family abortive infection protein n=1 Tax=Microbacterium galbinum TaxID=2851646 RepID=UPI001FFC73B7|nr:AbiV family abortive infection protein [Microbacterium galbinum]MCK2024362.1 AbiV family abortive infection protein [Microbacterium galbinum]